METNTNTEMAAEAKQALLDCEQLIAGLKAELPSLGEQIETACRRYNLQDELALRAREGVVKRQIFELTKRLPNLLEVISRADAETAAADERAAELALQAAIADREQRAAELAQQRREALVPYQQRVIEAGESKSAAGERLRAAKVMGERAIRLRQEVALVARQIAAV